jgi:RNA polymerase-binding transcription factor DksA
MDVERYRRKLLDLEASLVQRSKELRTDAVESAPDGPADAADASLADFTVSEALTEAESDADVLHQVREALLRIDAGTFGRCLVDGAAIEDKRLEAMPWTPYCLRHAQALEAETHRSTPTL